MKTKNIYGLSRAIPENIKREVRKKCGFGCVVCGKFPYHYDHYNRQFCDSEEHNPSSIILLCANHHDRKTRGLWSDENIRKCALNPKCIQDGWARDSEWLYVEDEEPIILLGTNEFRGTLCINEKMIFAISKPEIQGTPFMINATLYDPNGETVLKIVNNEWQISSQNWDVKAEGNTLVVNKAPKQIILKIIALGSGRFSIDKMDMMYTNVRLKADESGTSIILGTESESNAVSFINCILPQDINVAVSKRKNSIKHSTEKILKLSKEKIGRNQQCVCHSGKKYKKCCGKVVTLQ